MSMELQIAAEDAPKLTQALQDFAAKRGMSFKDASLPTTRFVSLCNDRGVTAQLSSTMGVFELRPDSGWERTTKELIDTLEASWPDRISTALQQAATWKGRRRCNKR